MTASVVNVGRGIDGSWITFWLDFRDLKSMGDRPTGGPTDGRTDPNIESLVRD